jgi:hypothetical protein|tara:strand:- start:163 stop:585 length:423 start_codon:yes stop_codon:yes gene_type:complete
MGNLGEIAEIVNASELTLEVGSDNYILLSDLSLHIGRTESRDVVTSGDPLYSYGSGDNYFTATLLVSTPELTSLNTLTQISANGDLTSTAWKIVAKNVSGATKTFSATGVLRDYDISKPSEGKVSIDIFVRITGDTISIS